MSDISMLDRAKLACNTMKALLGENPAEPTEVDKNAARHIFQTLTKDVEKKSMSLQEIAEYPNASLLHLDRMLSEYDQELINSAIRIREYVKNKLLLESDNPDGKIRIRALELLGKMKDVGLFTERLEITNKNKTDEELEAELNSKIERYMGVALVVQDVQPVEEEDESAMQSPPAQENADPLRKASALIDNLVP